MGHMLELSDEQFSAIEAAAQEQGMTLPAYLDALTATMRKPRQVYDNLEDFFRSLGATEDQIARNAEGIDAAFPPDEAEDADANL